MLCPYRSLCPHVAGIVVMCLPLKAHARFLPKPEAGNLRPYIPFSGNSECLSSMGAALGRSRRFSISTNTENAIAK